MQLVPERHSGVEHGGGIQQARARNGGIDAGHETTGAFAVQMRAVIFVVGRAGPGGSQC